MRRMLDSTGEQLELFTDAAERPRRAAPDAGPSRAPRARPATNDMALVVEILTVAAGPGYLLEDTPAGARVWRASGNRDARSEPPALVRAAHDDAVIVNQLLARGWLHRAAHAQTRTGIQPGQSSGRRRYNVEAHALSLPAAARRSLARWSALIAIPTQPDTATRP